MQAIASPSGCEFMAVKPYHVQWRWAMMSQRKKVFAAWQGLERNMASGIFRVFQHGLGRIAYAPERLQANQHKSAVELSISECHQPKVLIDKLFARCLKTCSDRPHCKGPYHSFLRSTGVTTRRCSEESPKPRKVTATALPCGAGMGSGTFRLEAATRDRLEVTRVRLLVTQQPS